MANDIDIVKVEQDAKDGMVVTFPDATIGTCVVEELLELRQCPELANKAHKQNPPKPRFTIQLTVRGGCDVRMWSLSVEVGFPFPTATH
jgi:hypothetical protein